MFVQRICSKFMVGSYHRNCSCKAEVTRKTTSKSGGVFKFAGVKLNEIQLDGEKVMKEGNERAGWG